MTRDGAVHAAPALRRRDLVQQQRAAEGAGGVAAAVAGAARTRAPRLPGQGQGGRRAAAGGAISLVASLVVRRIATGGTGEWDCGEWWLRVWRIGLLVARHRTGIASLPSARSCRLEGNAAGAKPSTEKMPPRPKKKLEKKSRLYQDYPGSGCA